MPKKATEPMDNRLFYGMLGVFAAQVDDLETMRIASMHRYRLLATQEEDKDGIMRGLGLGTDHPESKRLQGVVGGMTDLEAAAIKNLQSLMRQSAWGPWVAKAPGVGEKQLARLLSAIGDPYWHAVEERPRRVGELWAYCGYHAVPVGRDGKTIVKTSGDDQRDSETHTVDVVPGSESNSDYEAYFAAPRRQRGVQANWSEDARKRAWLIATSCVKQKTGTRYREVYDNTRAKYEEAVHQVSCIRCGPSGKPAEIGTPLSNGHQHGRALRAVAKKVLQDVWVEARRQAGDEDPNGPDAQERRDREMAAKGEPVLISA
jgi:hypothetical protein